MNATDPFRYLFFNAGATRRIAASPWALLVGALLVVTAGIARNYDHLDLHRDSEWMVGPFVVSLISSVWIFFFVAIVLGLPSKKLPQQWLVVVGLFWMTAPCAWLYALPVERWMDLVGAAKWNIAFLVIVSLWRVALIANALRVLTGNHVWRCLFAVLLPAAIEMLVALFFKQMSLVSIMGGVRLSPDNQALLKAVGVIFFVCIWGIPALVIAHAAVGRRIPKARVSLLPERWQRGFPRDGIFVAVAVIGVAYTAAQLTVQPRVRLTRNLDRMASAEDWDGVLALAARTKPDDYSPHHFFPPRPYGIHFAFKTIVEVATRYGDRAPEWLVGEWHRNAVLSIEATDRPGYSYRDVDVVRAWGKTDNGRRFLAAHQDVVLAATHESERIGMQKLLDSLEAAPSFPTPE